MELKNIEVTQIEAQCFGGSNICDCIREAIFLAIQEGRKVCFRHNGKHYTVNPESIIAEIRRTS